jgi:hypothetical protein
MDLDPKWVPMKWPCGPLEWARRNKSKSGGAELKETLEAWAQPAALDLLKGTPISKGRFNFRSASLVARTSAFEVRGPYGVT